MFRYLQGAPSVPHEVCPKLLALLITAHPEKWVTIRKLLRSTSSRHVLRKMLYAEVSDDLLDYTLGRIAQFDLPFLTLWSKVTANYIHFHYYQSSRTWVGACSIPNLVALKKSCS